MFNLTTERAKRKELAAQIRMSMMLEKSMASRMRREFQRLAKVVAQQYREQGVIRVDAQHATNVLNALRSYLSATARIFAMRILDHAPAKAFNRVRHVKATEDQVMQVVQRTLGDTLGAKVAGIVETSRKKLADIVLKGQADDLTASEIADVLENEFGGAIAGWRAEQIARTEVHTASMVGSLSAADSLGLTLDKEWVSAEDGRTRPSHAEANGQTVGRDEGFQVGDATLQYPGDPEGPPEEVINCRCAMVYHEHVAEDTGDEGKAFVVPGLKYTWDESLHPREPDGRFAAGDGGVERGQPFRTTQLHSMTGPHPGKTTNALFHGNNRDYEVIRDPKGKWRATGRVLRDGQPERSGVEPVKQPEPMTPQKEPLADTKVVGKDGKPMMMYHGTTGEFDKTNPHTFWTSDPKAAETYAGWNYDSDGPRRMIEANLAIKNPARDKDIVAAATKIGVSLENDTPSGMIYELLTPGHTDRAPDVMKELQRRGFDGAHVSIDFTSGGKELQGGSWMTFSHDSVIGATSKLLPPRKTA